MGAGVAERQVVCRDVDTGFLQGSGSPRAALGRLRGNGQLSPDAREWVQSIFQLVSTLEDGLAAERSAGSVRPEDVERTKLPFDSDEAADNIAYFVGRETLLDSALMLEVQSLCPALRERTCRVYGLEGYEPTEANLTRCLIKLAQPPKEPVDLPTLLRLSPG